MDRCLSQAGSDIGLALSHIGLRFRAGDSTAPLTILKKRIVASHAAQGLERPKHSFALLYEELDSCQHRDYAINGSVRIAGRTDDHVSVQSHLLGSTPLQTVLDREQAGLWLPNHGSHR